MKKLFSKKQLNRFKRSINRMHKGTVPALLVGLVVLAGLSFKRPAHAYYDDGGSGAARGALWGGLTGATIGGIAGGGRGAGIGAAAGLGLGALIGGASSRRSSGRDPYRKLDREERRLAKLRDQAAKYQDQMKTATSERRHNRAARRFESTQSKIRSKERDIQRLKQNLGIRQRPGYRGY